MPLLPSDLVSCARRLSDAAFVQRLHGAPLLLVRSTGREPALLHGLEATDWESGEPAPPSPDGLPFATVTVSLSTARVTALRAQALEATQYAVVVHKRAAARTLSEHRIRIGRSHNNDIVLRDPSVSKLHAWFERDAEGNYFLSDAGSRNGTRVSGEVLVPRRATPVAPGTAIQLGSVEATLCSPSEFRELAVVA